MTREQDYELRRRISYLKRVAEECGLAVNGGEILAAAAASLAPRPITEYEAKERSLKADRQKRRRDHERDMKKPQIHYHCHSEGAQF